MKLDVILWLVAAVVPGAALIRLLWPQAGPLQIVACAPTLSFGFTYVVGLTCSRLSVSPLAGVLWAVVVLVLAALGADVWRRRAADEPLVPRVRPRLLLGRSPAQYASWALLGGGVVLGALLWRRFQSTMLVPVGWDAMHHGFFIEQIARWHTMDASVVLASDASAHDGGSVYYPLAFNLIAAVLHTYAGSTVSTLMLASTVALAGVLLPVASYAMARELDRDQYLVAGFAAITPVLPIVLYLIEGTGRLTGILGVALVPGLVTLLIAQRSTPLWSRLPLALVGVIGIIGVHTSEAPMALILAGACMVVWLFQGGGLRPALHWFAGVSVAVVAGVVLLVIIEPAVVHLASERGGAMGTSLTRPSGLVLHTALSTLGQAWVLPLVGCGASLLPRWRRYLGPAIALAAFTLLYFLLAVGVKVIVPTLAVPWYTNPGRLAWDLTVAAAVPTAVGLVAVAGVVGSAGAAVARFVTGSSGDDTGGAPGASPGARVCRGIVQWTPPLLTAFVGVLIVVAFALPPVGRQGRFVSYVAGPVDRDSQAAFRYLAAHTRPGERVLDDLRTDGAMWMYVDDGVPTVFGNSPLLGDAPDSWLERLWLSRRLWKIGSDPCVRAMLDKYHVRYVYAGDTRIFDGWSNFRAEEMKRYPGLVQVFHRGNAHVFEVLPGQVAGVCDRDLTLGTKWGKGRRSQPAAG